MSKLAVRYPRASDGFETAMSYPVDTLHMLEKIESKQDRIEFVLRM